jgi:hypothetical protein
VESGKSREDQAGLEQVELNFVLVTYVGLSSQLPNIRYLIQKVLVWESDTTREEWIMIWPRGRNKVPT